MKTLALMNVMVAAGIAVASSTQISAAQEIADTIYFGGPILTMDDAVPRVEAVAVQDGTIIGVGSLQEVDEYKAAATRLVDLEGHAMLPGFVDSHGHVVGGGLQALSANLLAAPDGPVSDIASLQQSLREWISANSEFIDTYGVAIGFGYDPAQLAENRHPTRDDLDAVSDSIPIYVVHQSGHIGAANSVMLEQFGIRAGTKAPEGGVIRRRADSDEPNGVLEGNAHFGSLQGVLLRFGQSGMVDFARAGLDMWARFGFTTAQEGRANSGTLAVLRQLASTGDVAIDVAVYPDVMIDRNVVLQNMSRDYDNRVRVAGGKLTIDGSPQGFTALRDKPYYDPVGDYAPGYVGLAYESVETVNDMLGWAFENDVQMLVHANGEGASDRLIAAIELAMEEHGPGDRRPVLIHGQFLREDQVDSYQRLGVFPSLFPMHTFYWGDWHRDHTVGPAAADNISPTGWFAKRGMMFGTHHDAPVAFPDSMRVLDATVTRRTRSGDILGPTQRVDVMTALKAMTIWPAYQHFEEDSKGTIEVGKLADFVVLSADPTVVDPETLATLKVVKTIKEDRAIYDVAED